MAKKKPKVNWGPMGALSLPKALMTQSDFRDLSPSALKVLMMLGYQYNGRNNGDLSATHKMMKDWGGMAKATLASALKELLERNLIMRTRYYDRSRDGGRPALFALTWAGVDECPGKELEVPASAVPKRKLSV
ncbi:hypothetical protein [Stutzerimonas stutzeri]|uniref:hypothetical protein n=1 Tax=Stutzerimonas stutzeri TaxID=316 RepID=UPI0019F15BB7|nr:hypothetical protein [Stutzerimonas stutzeri]MBD9411269.1 MarR family transcriptional regulator [Stutzerimonas stutzeri]